MKNVPLTTARNVGELVAEVERTGEGIVLTRNGQPAATLEPVRGATDPARVREALHDLAALRDELSSKGLRE